MGTRDLKNKPLVEAIFEIRWRLQQKAPGLAVDPHYRLLLGRLFDRLSTEYREHEQLDSANVPDEMIGHVVQHRFRVAPNSWPLVQLGPGILTINDTDKYKWEDFQVRITDVKSKLYEAYPKPADLVVENLILRYIDAVEFDYQSSDVLQFLRDKLKIRVELPTDLFQSTDVEAIPSSCQLHQMFKSNTPPGVIELRLATGLRSDKPSLIWETILHSAGADIPDMSTEFQKWLTDAHRLVNDWFFKMIDGELRERFSNG